MHLSNWVEYCGALRLAGTVYRAVLARTQTFNFISGTLFTLPPSISLAESVAAWQHGSAAARRAARLSSSQVTQFRLHFGLSIEHFMRLGATTDAAVDVAVVAVDHLP